MRRKRSAGKEVRVRSAGQRLIKLRSRRKRVVIRTRVRVGSRLILIVRTADREVEAGRLVLAVRRITLLLPRVRNGIIEQRIRRSTVRIGDAGVRDRNRLSGKGRRRKSTQSNQRRCSGKGKA